MDTCPTPPQSNYKIRLVSRISQAMHFDEILFHSPDTRKPRTVQTKNYLCTSKRIFEINYFFELFFSLFFTQFFAELNFLQNLILCMWGSKSAQLAEFNFTNWLISRHKKLKKTQEERKMQLCENDQLWHVLLNLIVMIGKKCTGSALS